MHEAIAESAKLQTRKEKKRAQTCTVAGLLLPAFEASSVVFQRLVHRTCDLLLRFEKQPCVSVEVAKTAAQSCKLVKNENGLIKHAVSWLDLLLKLNAIWPSIQIGSSLCCTTIIESLIAS
jgi:hypothetical protein